MKKKLIMIVGVVAVVGVGAVVVMPKLSAKPAAAATTAGAKPSASPSAKPGAVLKEDSITLNLSDGHYLRLGLALQLPAGVSENDVDGSHALDIAIQTLSGKSEAELSGPGRAKAEKELSTAIVAAYGATVVQQVYLTDFVMQ